ncbi:hypothetical protein ACSNOK_21715 [Streptomyces sp. URMC 126]|uniref:TolB family protein n=1 Tax=Streptomyces sp. URMC 126 TaxID=3423401 RepID=UPI003F1BA243
MRRSGLLRHAAVAAALSAGLCTALPTTTATAAPVPPRVTAAADVPVPRTEQVSVAEDGTPANAPVEGGRLSGDGRYVVFSSRAGNLVPGATGNRMKVFLKDLTTGRVELISAASGGAEADGDSTADSVSGDGRYVVFTSSATDLTGTTGTTPPTGRRTDVYVRDRATGRTEILDRDGDAASAPRTSEGQISDDGRRVAFLSTGGDGYAYLHVRDRRERTTVRVGGKLSWGVYASPVISADGSKVGFKSYGISPGTTAPSVAPSARTGRPGVPRPAPDRRFYVYDVRTRTTRLAARGLDDEDVRADRIALSPDGRYALFSCTSQRVVENDTNEAGDVFATDLATDEVRLLSLAPGGAQADGGSTLGGLMSADNGKVFFTSRATNLVPGDTNDTDDVFVRNLTTGAVERVSTAPDGSQRSDHARLLGVDRAGDTVLFGSSPDEPLPKGPATVTGLFVRRPAP